jgi:hypothetical protein
MFLFDFSTVGLPNSKWREQNVVEQSSATAALDTLEEKIRKEARQHCENSSKNSIAECHLDSAGTLYSACLDLLSVLYLAPSLS